MYAVFATTWGEKPDLKFFDLRADASGYASGKVADGADVADVYELLGITDARKAKAALEMGEGRFVEAHGRRATEAEIREWSTNVLLRGG